MDATLDQHLQITGPDDPRVRLFRDAGDYCLACGWTAEAATYFLALERLLPRHFVGAMGLADCFCAAGRWSEARRFAERAVAREGHSSGTLAWCGYLLGKALLGLGEVDACVRELELSIQFDPQRVGKQSEKLLQQVRQLVGGVRSAASGLGAR